MNRSIAALALAVAFASTANAALQPGYAVLQDGHLDTDMHFVPGDTPDAGTWTASIGFDGPDGTIEYALDEALLYVGGPDAQLPRPANDGIENWDFLGVAEGETIYFAPQTQIPGVIWPGFESAGSPGVPADYFMPHYEQDARQENGYGPWLTVRIKDVRGPGDFSLFDSGFVSTRVWAATSDGLDEADQILHIRGHEHYNWAFTQPGYYEIDLQFAGVIAAEDVYDADGNPVLFPVADDPEHIFKQFTYNVSPIFTLHFGVETTAVPEPASYALVSMSIAALTMFRRRAAND